MGAVILLHVAGAQSQSAAEVQFAIGILTNPSSSPLDWGFSGRIPIRLPRP